MKELQKEKLILLGRKSVSQESKDCSSTDELIQPAHVQKNHLKNVESIVSAKRSTPMQKQSNSLDERSMIATTSSPQPRKYYNNQRKRDSMNLSESILSCSSDLKTGETKFKLDKYRYLIEQSGEKTKKQG